MAFSKPGRDPADRARALIFLNPAPCGAGKTRAAVHRATALSQRGEKVVLVQPSRLLVAHTEADLVAAGAAKVTAMHGGKAAFAADVIGAIVRHIRDTPHGGEVLLITHAA